jgi:transposase
MAGRKPYSDDLRLVLVGQIEAGRSRREAGRQLKVSAATAVRWAKRAELTGSVSPDRPGRRSGSPLDAHTSWLLELIQREPDLTLVQIVARIGAEKGLKTSKSAVDRFFGRQGYTFKKNAAGGRTRAA